MTNTIKQLLVGATMAVLICAAGCSQHKGSKELAARKGSKELAAQLLQTSGLHALFAEGYAAGYHDSAKRDRLAEKEINCVETKITPEFMLAPLSDVYSAEFSDDELRQAISFFESRAGKAFILSERNVAQALRGRPTEPEPELSSHEVESVEAFSRTRIGQLIMTPHSALAEKAKEELRPKFFAIFDQCKNAS